MRVQPVLTYWSLSIGVRAYSPPGVPGLLKYALRHVSVHHAVIGPPSSSGVVSGRPGTANLARFAFVIVTAGISRVWYFGPSPARMRSAVLKNTYAPW